MSEYWIKQDGGVEFADGDIGDWNHEAIVINILQKDIISKCDQFNVRDKRGRPFDESEYLDWDGFQNSLAVAFAKNYIEQYPNKRKTVKLQLENDPDVLIQMDYRRCGVTKAELIGLQSDARDYAMQYWGWKTYRNENIDTWRLTRADLQAIVYGLGEIAEQEGWSDKKLNRSSFSINIFSNKKHFTLSSFISSYSDGFKYRRF